VEGIPQRVASISFSTEHTAVEWWDGNGGQMDVARPKQAAARKPRVGGSKTGRRSSKLSEAAGKALDAKGEMIVDKLVESALKGHTGCAQLLVKLAGEPDDGVENGKKRRVRSWAKALAAEREWNGESSEEDAEIGSGRREPEE